MTAIRPLAVLLLVVLHGACATFLEQPGDDDANTAGGTGHVDVADSRRTPGTASRRAVLLSLDALSEQRVRALPARVAPNLQAMFRDGACAAYAVPAFPSVTAAGHAAISTGAYGDVNGVAANQQPTLPRERNRLTDLESGYLAGPLRAEPIWITAALAGLDVVSHHFTQAPQPPGYRPVTTGDTDFAHARARAEHALALPGVALMNGYNRVFTRGIVVTDATAPTRIAAGWSGIETLPAGTLPPREASWLVLDDSVFALFYGTGRYTHARVALARDVARSVEVVAAPADTTSPASRPLARHFSDPITLSVGDGRVFLRARLFDLSADGTSFLLFHPALGIVETNRPDIDDAYDAAVTGWAGNGLFAMGPNGFGAAIIDGGDGTAEARYLESLEFVTRQYIAGSEWAWRVRRPDLLVDYFPVADEIDHNMYGWLTDETPGHDPVIAARYAPYREHGWKLVDMRLEHLMRLVADDDDAAIFVTGDHGMRPYWRIFRPNAALRDDGMLTLDDDGNVDLSRTRAFAPSGFWIAVNHTGWRDGIVPQDSIDAVVDAAERVLLDARGVDGEIVVTRTWRTAHAAHDTAVANLGIGGPAGGELYFELARGYYYSWQHTGDVANAVRPNSGHGFPSTTPEMHTALCGWGSALPARRTGAARIIDVAPTVAEWLGIPAPPHSRGTSRLSEWLQP